MVKGPMTLELVFITQQGDFPLHQFRRGSGATNTITRAELAAIASILLLVGQKQDQIMATDSKASNCMIARYIDSAQNLQQSKRKLMLEDIIAQLLARAKKQPARDTDPENEVSYLSKI